VTIFIALKKHPYIKLIFQNWENPVQRFNIGPFQFTLFHDVDGLDICRYNVTLGEYTALATFMGIDTTVSCGPRSNVDFVYFEWLHNDMVGFRRHAMIFLTNSPITHGRLLCLRH
jgi:hypothetical protein